MVNLEMKMRQLILLWLAMVGLSVLQVPANAQAPAAVRPADTPPSHPELTYVRPTEKIKIHNYLFDAFGPYPIIGAAFAAGINQAESTPPEWKQGVEGYGKRFGSNFAIAVVSTTTRYALAQAFREDTLYYRCECKAWFPRMGHAVFSTFTARRGQDGHTVFSVPALVAPYAGTMTAAYGWYPARYNAQDGFRMGNYSLLGYVGGNLALEFLYGGPHTLLSRFHLFKRHGSTDALSKP
jgi:hypothetical protein